VKAKPWSSFASVSSRVNPRKHSDRFTKTGSLFVKFIVQHISAGARSVSVWGISGEGQTKPKGERPRRMKHAEAVRDHQARVRPPRLPILDVVDYRTRSGA
jgi:hypothetical protein